MKREQNFGQFLFGGCAQFRGRRSMGGLCFGEYNNDMTKTITNSNKDIHGQTMWGILNTMSFISVEAYMWCHYLLYLTNTRFI